MNILSLVSIKRLVFLGGCSLTTALSANIFDQSISALNEIDNSKMRNEATAALNPLQQNQAPTLQDRVIPVSDKHLQRQHKNLEASNGIPKFYVGGIGATLGASTYGLRAGLDLNLGIGQCRDACGFYGLVLGTDRPWRKEYFLGVTLMGIYMGSVFAEADIKFRDTRYNGVRVTAGVGIYS